MLWVIIGCIIVFTGFALLGFWRQQDLKKTADAVERINSRKITLDDVMGKNLPSPPDQTVNDSTVAGIDANNNAIRDDVELEIFKRYPNSARIRAAMLQYAQALQLELTEVFNSETLVKVLQKRSYARSCIDQTGPEINLKSSHEEILNDMNIGDNRKKEIDNLVINIHIREKKQSDGLNYMTTYSIPSDQLDCDIKLLSLPN